MPEQQRSSTDSRTARPFGIRNARDWATTPIGSPESWPSALNTLVDVMERSAEPMFVVWGPQHTLLYNAAYSQVLANKHPAAQGSPFLAVWLDLATQLAPMVDRAYAGLPGKAGEPEFFVRQGDGHRELSVSFSYQPVRLDDGTVAGFFCKAEHSVADTAAENDRAKAEARFRAAFDMKTVGILHWDESFRLSEVNDAFLAMTGFSREEALGMSWQDLTPEEFWPASLRAVEEVSTLGEATPYEKQYSGKGGRRWWGLFAPRRVDDGALEFVLDITERKQVEARLRELNEQLEHRVVEELSVRLKTEDALRQSQKLEAIGQLTGGVAHDFNNLLTVIRGSAEMLRRPSLADDKRTRYVEAIADTADRAAKLTNQLLAFSRRQALRPEVFNVGERIGRIKEMVRTVVGGQVVLHIDTDCEVCYVEADPSQFETAIVNLTVNARDAMNGAGRIEIRADHASEVPAVRGHGGAAGDFVAVSVTDTGTGIRPEQMAQIFEPFFTTKEVGKGTGLGLSQVYGFAKQSGGEVEVSSPPGAGATFTIFLPRVPAGMAEAALETAASEQARGSGHVLVVEDNEQVGKFTTELLHELGFRTTWASNADAALDRLRESPGAYDAVFSDVVMPGKNGIELAREIASAMPDVPIVLTSGYSHVLAQEGSHGFELLKKPYSVDDLTRALRNAIRSRGATRNVAALATGEQ